jgi:hypothetical protein
MAVGHDKHLLAARAGAGAIDPAVLQGIRQASRSTNVDFGYLMAQADQESGFNADAKTSAGSATGLFQFIDSTWLDMVRLHGAQHGLGQLAQQVTTDASGRTTVADPKIRAQILDLRKDPRLSAALAAELARDNKTEVERALGRPAGSTDLYLAHFLGAGGASEVLKAIDQNGATPAAALLPEAAAANRAVFFDGKTGAPRSVADLYRNFADRIETNAASYGRLDGPNAATPASDGGSWVSGRFDLSRTASTPLSVFNAMMLAALKLLGGTSSRSSALDGGTSAVSTVGALDHGGRRRNTTAT